MKEEAKSLEPYREGSKSESTLADFLGKLIEEDNHSDEDDNLTSNTDKEISLYASLPRLSMKSDPLVWWREHRETFPYLAQLAQKYLSIQAMSVSSERVFSAAGNIVTNQRNCLKLAKVNMPCFLAANL
ncbi:E3 SUMO-protein ligase ZBED1-like [Watersipora subatra]|uniref:E3 SUMO-protein ligase ZBED1-like n=1 Tax=Watersipora subatra TaxID=2589382 RepID=UPI00355C7F5A